ncbi:MAG TPA: hypothetical protein VG078_07305, partial [Acidimicrobiales bacterium]|nr:hypothetical protein [Acidimicrobiales bacterium]
PEVPPEAREAAVEGEPEEEAADDEGSEWEPQEWRKPVPPRQAAPTGLVEADDEEPDEDAWDSVLTGGGQPPVERDQLP